MRLVEGTVAIDAAPPGDGEQFRTVEGFLERLDSIESTHDVTVQALDARLVCGRAHLESAVEHANRSIARGEAIATDRAVEILCYVAGTRQIDRALELGVEPGVTPIVVIVDNGRTGLSNDKDSTAGGDEGGAAQAVASCLSAEATLDRIDETAVMEYFGVTEAERSAVDGDLETLIRERVALLDVEK